MSAELIAILAIGAGMGTILLTFAGLTLALINQSNKEARQRTERLEYQMNRGFEQLRSEMNHQANGLRAEMDRGFERLRSEMNHQVDGLRAEMDRGFEQLRSEMNHQVDGLRAEVNRQLESLRSEMNRRFDEQDVRIRGLEQGQAYMSGQFSELKDHLTHHPSQEGTPDTGD